MLFVLSRAGPGGLYDRTATPRVLGVVPGVLGVVLGGLYDHTATPRVLGVVPRVLGVVLGGLYDHTATLGRP